MCLARLRELHKARPFVPFTLTLADGRKVAVPHRKFLYLFPSGRGALVTRRDDRFTLIDSLSIASVNMVPGYRSRPQPRRRPKKT